MASVLALSLLAPSLAFADGSCSGIELAHLMSPGGGEQMAISINYLPAGTRSGAHNVYSISTSGEWEPLIKITPGTIASVSAPEGSYLVIVRSGGGTKLERCEKIFTANWENSHTNIGD